MLSRSGFVAALLLLQACAASKPAANVEPSPAPAAAEAGRWTPGPGADAALAALWKSEPFALPAAELAKASGGALPSFMGSEVLLSEETVHYDAQGRATRTVRTVYRILSDAPELKTQGVFWAAWHQQRPVIKTRVVSADGHERWLDPATIVEGTAASSAQYLTDARMLEAPLPGARIGSVVEEQIILEDREPAFPAAASGRFRTWNYEPLRRVRLKLEHPASLPLVPIVIGGGTLAESTRGGLRTLSLDIAQPDFNAFRLAREDVSRLQPRVEWSTAASWSTVARAYLDWMNQARAGGLDTSEIQRLAASASTRAEKLQLSLSWLRQRARYSALHLGAGALKPTPPQTVLERGYGDCKDLALALTVILESVGVPAMPALVQSSGIPTAEGAPGITGFDHMIVYVPRQGSEPATWVDATDDASPAGVLTTALLDRKALVLSSDTRGLTALPTRAQTVTTITERLTVQQADFGRGKLELSRQFDGPLAGSMRAALRELDDAGLKKFLLETDQRLFGDDELKIELHHRAAGQGSPKLVATSAYARGIGTSATQASLALEGPYVAYWVVERLLGADTAKKETNPEQLKKKDAEALEATGLTSAELDLRPVRLPSQVVLQRTVKVIPARGFVASELPPPRKLMMGPASWTEQFTALPDGSVEATYRFETGAVDFDPQTLETFRGAFWRFSKENWPQLTLKLAPQLLVDRARPQEAMAIWRKELAERPNDPSLRARYAEFLAGLGLNDLARPEIDRAFKDGPKHPLVLMIKGDVARRSPEGLINRPPFDRPHAIEAFRAAATLLPDHNWPRLQLAALLERDNDGEVRWQAGKELDEASALYVQLLDEDALESAATSLYDLHYRIGNFKQIVELKQRHGQSLTADIYGLSAGIFANGPEDAKQHLRTIADPTQRVTSAAQLLGVLSLSRDYRVVDAVAAAFEPELVGGPGGILRGIFTGLKAWPVERDLSQPERAMRSALSTFTQSFSAPARVAALKELATPAGKKELDAYGLGPWGAWSRVAGAAYTDALLTRGKCEVDGDPAVAVRVQCAANMGQALNSVAYWVPASGGFKLESVGWLSTLAENAWVAASGGKTAAARLWLNWVAEALDKVNSGATSADLTLFKASWPVRGEPTREQLLFAASQAFALSNSKKMPPAAVEQLAAARLKATGSKRRLADEVLGLLYLRRNEPARGVQILKPLAEAEGEERLFKILARAHARAGQVPQARALTRSALARTPSDLEWVDVAAAVASRDDKYPEAVGLLQAAYDRTGDRSLLNELAWCRLMAGQLDEETEKLANLLSSNERASRAELHTAALVLLERGRIEAAAQLAQRLVPSTPSSEPWDDARLQLRARFLQVLGYPAESRLVWAKMKSAEGDLARLRERALKQLDGKKL